MLYGRFKSSIKYRSIILNFRIFFLVHLQFLRIAYYVIYILFTSFKCLIRNLRTLFLEESSIIEKDGEWLHELALNNNVLETLNFYMTDLEQARFQDLELIARNCHSLVSVKISECELLDLVGFFRAATALQEFGGGSFNEQPERYSSLSFPSKLCCLGLTYMGQNEMPIIFPFASLLRRLDLLYALLDTDDHCLLIQRCPNLEVLEVESHNYFLSYILCCFDSWLFHLRVLDFASVFALFSRLQCDRD